MRATGSSELRAKPASKLKLAYKAESYPGGLAQDSRLETRNFFPMPGYSGTPLPKKLGIKDNFRVALLHMPDDVEEALRDALATCQSYKLASKNFDFIFLFAKSRAALERDLFPASKALAPAGMLWLSWPKKSSGVATDLDENYVRQSGLAAGLVDIKVCAVTDVWSGLKFVIPVKNRPKAKPRL